MAVYTKTFGSDTVGQAPSGMTVFEGPTGWTVESVADALNGKALKVETAGSSANRGIKLDDLDSDPDRADFEVVFRGKNSALSSNVEIGAVGRANTDIDWVRGLFRNGGSIMQVDQLVNGSFSASGTGNITQVPAGDWFLVRFRVVGNDYYVRGWNASNPEPEIWTASWLNRSSVNAAGFIGLGLFRVDGQDTYVDYISVATGTDTAPLPTDQQPELTNPTAAKNGTDSYTGSVDSASGAGTLYHVVTTSATEPSSTQIKAGQDHTGSAAPASDSQAISQTGTQNVSGTGLTADTTYYIHYVQSDGSTDSAVVSSGSFKTDAVALELSNPTAAKSGANGYTASVDSVGGAGTLYHVVTTSATKPSVAQIKAGQDNTGSAAPASGSQAITAAGTQNVSGTGLTALTAYYVHFVKTESAVDSNVVTSNAFTTDAESLPTPTNLSATNITATSATLNWDRGV